MPLTDPATHTREQIQACCQALFDKKAEDITLLYLGDKSSVADYFIIATGTSDPHLRALTNTAYSTLRDLHVPMVGADRSPSSGWGVVDAFDFIIHVFTPAVRAHYNLEGLWRDAERIPLDLE